MHLNKAFQQCKQRVSKALQKCKSYNFILILANYLFRIRRPARAWTWLPPCIMIVSFARIPLWELGTFCKRTSVDLLATMPKWINMRALLQQRGDVAHWVSSLSAPSKASQTFPTSVIPATTLSHHCFFYDFSHFPQKCVSLIAAAR